MDSSEDKIQSIWTAGCPLNIELKYGQTMLDDSEEMGGQQLELNTFVDTILEVVEANARDLVILHSFNADICS